MEVSRMAILKQSAQTLPENLRKRVLEECKKAAAPHPFDIIMELLLLLAFGRGAVLLIQVAVDMPQYWYMIPVAIILAAVPVTVIYLNTKRLRRTVIMVKRNDFTYYMGELTGKRRIRENDPEGNKDKAYTFYLYIDKAVRCPCTPEQYANAVRGEQYIALFFGKDKPEICVKVTQKDII